MNLNNSTQPVELDNNLNQKQSSNCPQTSQLDPDQDLNTLNDVGQYIDSVSIHSNRIYISGLDRKINLNIIVNEIHSLITDQTIKITINNVGDQIEAAIGQYDPTKMQHIGNKTLFTHNGK